MLARKVNPARARDCDGKVTESNKCPRAARPLVLHPALCRTLLEAFAQPTKHLIQLLQRCGHTLVLFELRESLCFARPRVGHQDPAWSRLVPRWLPDFDRAARKREPVQSFRFPNSIMSLQVNTCH